MPPQQIGFISNASSGLVRLFGFAFRLRLMFFFMLFVVINSIIIGIDTGNFQSILTDLGSRFLTPTLRIQELSLEIIDRGGLYSPTPHFWGGMVNFGLNLWDFLTQFYIILMWISVLSQIFTIIPIADTSKKPVAFFFAIPTYLVFQMIYIAKSGKGDFFQPINAFKDWFRAVIILLESTPEIQEKLTNSSSLSS